MTSIYNFDLPSSFSKSENMINLGHAQEYSIDASSDRMCVELYIVTHSNVPKDILVRCAMNSHLVNNIMSRESLHHYIKQVTEVGTADNQIYTFRTSSKAEYEKMKHKLLNAISIIESIPPIILRKLDLCDFVKDNYNWCVEIM